MMSTSCENREQPASAHALSNSAVGAILNKAHVSIIKSESTADII